jgi:NitT/TauT family transport system substrate-binding protein
MNFICNVKYGFLNKKVLYLFILIIMVVLGCSIAFKEEEQKIEQVNIAFQTWVGYGPFYLAKEKGFFKEQCIELLIVNETLDSARADAFKSKILDFEAGTLDLLISKRSKGVPVVTVIKLDYSFGGDAIVVSKDIKTIQELKGKEISFVKDNASDTFLSYVLKENGMSFEDIIIDSKAPDQVLESFLNKDSVAVVTWEPWVSKALEGRAGSHVLVSTKEIPDLIIDTLNVREDLIENKPELVKKVMRAWFKAIEYYKANSIEGSKIISKYYKITPEQYRERVKGLEWPDYKKQVELASKNKLEQVFESTLELKQMPGKLDKEKSINMELLETLYEDSK